LSVAKQLAMTFWHFIPVALQFVADLYNPGLKASLTPFKITSEKHCFTQG